MPHFITDKCIGCGVCEVKCPTNTIWGTSKEMFYIHPERCIDCSVCGIYCPVDAIQNQHGELIPRIKPKEIPKAEVINELCTGCEFCVDICPFECIAMVDAHDETIANHYKVALVDKAKCVACRLCESVCDKDAIVVPNAPTQLKGYLPDFVVSGTGR
jgi:electron transport complex protein RnfB